MIYSLQSNLPPLRPHSKASVSRPPPDRISVEVVLSQPAYYSGSAFRCSIEVRCGDYVGTQENRGLWSRIGLGGTGPTHSLKDKAGCLVLEELTACIFGLAVFDAAPPPGQDNHFANVLKAVGERINEAENARTRGSGTSSEPHSGHAESPTAGVERLTSILCSDLRWPVGSRSKLTFASDPFLICQNMFLNPDDPDRFYGFECLLPPFMPPSYPGHSARYGYYLYIRARSSSGEDAIKLPIQVIGPVTAGMPTLPTLAPPILPESIVGSIPESHSPNSNCSYMSFDFKSKTWQGGSCDGQVSVLPNYLSHEQLEPKTTQSSLESQSHLWHATSDIRKFGRSQYFNGLTNEMSYNRACTMAERALTCWPPFAQEIYRKKYFGDADNEEHPKRAQFRICQDNSVLAIMSLFGKHEDDGSGKRTVSVAAGGTITVALDFSTSDATTFETHAFLVREETDLTIKEGSKTQQTIKETAVVEHAEMVGHQLVAWFDLFVPPNQPPSFETDIVSVKYYLLFRFFCAGDKKRLAKLPTTPSKTKKGRLVDFEWRHPAKVLPPHVDDVDAPDLPFAMHSIAGNCSLLGEGLSRMHRQFLV
eukprot:Selendium_serpulae@DN4761_c0_g1_i10.p1